MWSLGDVDGLRGAGDVQAHKGGGRHTGPAVDPPVIFQRPARAYAVPTTRSVQENYEGAEGRGHRATGKWESFG